MKLEDFKTKRGALRIPCKRCGGRGWFKKSEDPSRFPEPCPLCEGRGDFTRKRLAALLHVSRETLYRFLNGAFLKEKTRERVLAGLKEIDLTPVDT